MSRFTKQSKIILDWWKIYTEDRIIREVGEVGSWEFVLVPPVFEYDWVSSPWFMWRYIPRIEWKTIIPWACHDRWFRIKGRFEDYVKNNLEKVKEVLQREGIDVDLFMKKLRNYSQKELNSMFKQQLIAMNNSERKSNVMYAGVRMWGWYYWNKPITENWKKYLVK